MSAESFSQHRAETMRTPRVENSGKSRWTVSNFLSSQPQLRYTVVKTAEGFVVSEREGLSRAEERPTIFDSYATEAIEIWLKEQETQDEKRDSKGEQLELDV
jgi:hypothetical protein